MDLSTDSFQIDLSDPILSLPHLIARLLLVLLYILLPYCVYYRNYFYYNNIE